MCKFYRLAIVVLLFIPAISNAQFGFTYDPSIPVVRSGDTLINPWAGGLNYAQFSEFDYDFDGDMDLFIFDRSSNNIRVYTQEGTTDKYYKFAYNAAQHFPWGINYRATLIDYDNDGKKDLFTSNLSGIRVYRNVGDAVNGLQWELFKDIVYTEYPNGTSILGVSVGDSPAIVDVDFDGDIDVLTFNSVGNRVEYHQNQSMDLYGIPDSLEFVLKNECWGKFTENDQNNGINLNDPNSPCVGGNIPNPERNSGNQSAERSGQHVGSSILALDIDSSGVMDLLIGDASYSSLTLLTNGGTAVNTDSPMISVEYNFPTNSTPIKVTLFPVAYFIDVDFDNVKDLIATPSAMNISFNETSVKYYKNIGTNGNPIFVHTSNNFLQSEMIEHGTGSTPILFDADDDGLKDLIVSNHFRFKPVDDKESTIAYYRNIGTANDPVYQYIDYNYLDLSNQSYGLKSTPAFGDLDSDGDEDLLLAIEDGTLVYYENLSVGAGAVWASPVFNYQDNLGATISSGSYAHPTLFDLNDDGLLDLIIGMKAGHLVYYENIGTSNSPSFQLMNSSLGNVDVSSTGFDGYATPHFFKVNNETQLFVGNFDGKLVYYDSIQANLGAGNSFNLRTTNYLGINVGKYSSFCVSDVDNDGNLNMFVGQDLGGIYHFEADPNSDLGFEEVIPHNDYSIAVYPNPSTSIVTISATISIDKYSILDVHGRVLLEATANEKKDQIDLSNFSNGLYILKAILSNGSVETRNILKQ
jgi:hypothetical protein